MLKPSVAAAPDAEHHNQHYHHHHSSTADARPLSAPGARYNTIGSNGTTRFHQHYHHQHHSPEITSFPATLSSNDAEPSPATGGGEVQTEDDEGNGDDDAEGENAAWDRQRGVQTQSIGTNTNHNNNNQHRRTDLAHHLQEAQLPCSSSSDTPSAFAFSTQPNLLHQQKQQQHSTNRRSLPLPAAGTTKRGTNKRGGISSNGSSGPNHTNNNIIVIPPPNQQIFGTNASSSHHHNNQRNSTAAPSTVSSIRNDEGMLVLVQQFLFEHYHTVAYILIIISYFAAFCEYLYLRLISLIFPAPIYYKRNCDKHYGELVYRNELHFASGLSIFMVMSIYQLVCFFLLTVSSNYLQVKRTFSQVISIEERLHHELVFAVKRTMFSTLYPTFGIYLLSSSAIFCSIYYMVGLRNPIPHVGSRVIVYVFDVCVILYFLAFPILCVLFHPDINCRSRLPRLYCLKKTAPPARNSQSLQTAASNGTEAKTDEGNRESSRGDIVDNKHATATVAHHQTGACKRIGGGGTRAVHPAPETTAAAKRTTARAMMATGAASTTTIGGRRGSAGGTNSNKINYGSLERRHPTTTIDVDEGGRTTQPAEEKGKKKEWNANAGTINNLMETRSDGDAAKGKENVPQTDSVRLRMRQRRQSRYKRLRGGSDESAECKMKKEEEMERAGDGHGIVGRLEANIRRNEQIQAEEEEEEAAENAIEEGNGVQRKRRRRRMENDDDVDGGQGEWTEVEEEEGLGEMARHRRGSAERIEYRGIELAGEEGGGQHPRQAAGTVRC